MKIKPLAITYILLDLVQKDKDKTIKATFMQWSFVKGQKGNFPKQYCITFQDLAETL